MGRNSANWSNIPDAVLDSTDRFVNGKQKSSIINNDAYQ